MALVKIPERQQTIDDHEAVLGFRIGSDAAKVVGRNDADTAALHLFEVVEAAHIKPYALEGPHSVKNGILLRSDLHKLFDLGYVTVTPTLKLEVSRRLKAVWENGREHYTCHGKELMCRPTDAASFPSREFLQWHNENTFKA